MTYRDLLKEVGDYTAVYTNLVLEEEMTWNVVGVLTNIIKCDKIGVKPSQESLGRYCNINRSTVIMALGVLRKKGIISQRGFSVNYQVLKQIVELCNQKAKELTNKSKLLEKPANCSENPKSEIVGKTSKKLLEKPANNIINNNINKTLYDTHSVDLNKRVKRNTYDMKKEYIKPKVLIRVNDLRTPEAKRLSSLRSRIEVAEENLISNLGNLVEGSNSHGEARECCFASFKEYRDRLVKAARNTKCTPEEYDIISFFYGRINDIIGYYYALADKRYGLTSIPARMDDDLTHYAHRPVRYEEMPEDLGLPTLNEAVS